MGSAGVSTLWGWERGVTWGVGGQGASGVQVRTDGFGRDVWASQQVTSCVGGCDGVHRANAGVGTMWACGHAWGEHTGAGLRTCHVGKRV